MKLTKLTALLLVATTALSVTALTSCKKQTSDSENPFNDPENPFNNDQLDLAPNIDSSYSFAPSTYNSEHSNGVLKMYSSTEYRGVARSGDLCVDNTLRYYSFEQPEQIFDETPLCFDPLCKHLHDGTCQGRIKGCYGEYPTFVFFDLYDRADAGVLYIGYKQSNGVTVNGEEIERTSDYCFERYDLSTGKREVIVNNLKNTVVDMCTYGDYIYFVENTTAESASLCRVHKSGSSVERLEGISASSIDILDIWEGTIYFTLDEKTLYSCSIELDKPKECIALQDLCGDGAEQGVFQSITGGYLYYFANYETVSATSPDGESTYTDTMCDVFRVPLSDLSATPEKIVENIASMSLYYAFTENVLYYEPMVFEYWPKKGMTAINISDGKLFALDLNTLESRCVAEDTGLAIMIQAAYDDVVLFGGWYYDEEMGKDLSGEGRNQLIGYSNGEPYKMWLSYNNYTM